jgi:hypothetical protein
MEDIKVIYSNKNIYDYFLINHFNHNVINKINNNNGTFSIDNNILEIKWNNKDKIEKFIKSNIADINDIEFIDTYTLIPDVDENQKKIEKEVEKKNQNNYTLPISVENTKVETSKKLYFVHPKWEDFILLFDDNTFIRESTKDTGNFSLEEEIVSIKWEKYSVENFILNKEDNNYYLLENNYFDINNQDDINSKSKNGIFFHPYNSSSIITYPTIDKLNKEILIYLEINNQKIQIFKNNVNITKNFNKKIHLKHINWEEEVSINFIDKLIYRNKNIKFDLFIIENIEKNNILNENKEYINNLLLKNSNKTEISLPLDFGSFLLETEKLIINWNHWGKETFINKNEKYVYQPELTEIFFYNNDWEDYCLLDNINIYKKNGNSLKGKFIKDDNKIIIEWINYGTEIFYLYDNKYYNENYIDTVQYNENNFKINYLNNIIYENNKKIGYFYFKKDKFIINYENEKEKILSEFYYFYDSMNNDIKNLDQNMIIKEIQNDRLTKKSSVINICLLSENEISIFIDKDITYSFILNFNERILYNNKSKYYFIYNEDYSKIYCLIDNIFINFTYYNTYDILSVYTKIENITIDTKKYKEGVKIYISSNVNYPNLIIDSFKELNIWLNNNINNSLIDFI